MNAVVLAGGVRSGLEVPGSSGLPRALWPFPSEPLISGVLRFLVNSGCQDIAICANGKTRMIAAELNEGQKPWLGLHYSEDRLPRGPAGCLRDLQEWLGSETFVAIQGTASYAFDLAAMREEHARFGAAVTVGARVGSDGTLEPAGVFLVEPRTLDLIPPVGFQDFKEQFLPKVIAAGMRVQCHVLQGKATLIHSPGHYLATIGDAIVAAGLPEGYLQRGPGVVVHETAQVHAGARLRGSVWVEAGAIVEAGAVIAGPAIVSAGARVGTGALVRGTVLMRDGVIEDGAQVIDEIVPPNGVRSGSVPQRKVRERERAGVLAGV